MIGVFPLAIEITRQKLDSIGVGGPRGLHGKKVDGGEEYHLVGSRGFCRREPAVGAMCYGLNFTKGTSLQLKHLSQTHSA